MAVPMMKTLGLDRLSVEERIQLAQEIWDSVAEEPTAVALTEAQKQEIDRRLAAHRADPGAVVSWDTVKARARARLRG
jgi:putative addiction module component (TIGR02574 family)